MAQFLWHHLLGIHQKNHRINNHDSICLLDLCARNFGQENFNADIVLQKRCPRGVDTVDFTIAVERSLICTNSEALQGR